MANFEKLDEVFELAQKNPNASHPIDAKLATFIIDNDLADKMDIEHKDRKMIMTITYRGIIFTWETRTTPWKDIRKKFVN